MGENGHTDSAELRLRKRADRQDGVLTREHLTSAGVTRRQLERRLATSRLTRVFPGVYVLGHLALRDEGWWRAAIWAYAPEAVLSHLSAAAFHGLLRKPPAAVPVHITTTRSPKSRERVVVHRVRELDRRDIYRGRGLTATTIPRTLVDLADILAWDAYRAVADNVRRLDMDALRLAQSRAPRRRGAALVHRLIEADDAHTKSEFERRFLRFLKVHGIAAPDALNVRVAGHTADCVYRDPDVVIELDGRRYHDRRSQMRADRIRDGDYQVAGFRILRLLWDDLHDDEAARTTTRIRAMLG